MYETFNMLLNSRRSAYKEDEHAKRMQAAEAEFLKSNEKNKHSNKKLSWIGYLVGSSKETYF